MVHEREKDGNFTKPVRFTVREMCSVQLKDDEKANDLMLILALTETVDKLLMGNSVHWYDHLLRGEDGCVLRSAFVIEIENQRMKKWLKRTWR